MKTVKLLSQSDEEFYIPLAATRLSEALNAEIECHYDEDDDDHSSTSGAGDEGHGSNVTDVVTVNGCKGKHFRGKCSATLSLTANEKVTSAALGKVADFLTHYETVEVMLSFEPPFTSEDIQDIVQQWYADFISVDKILLLDILAAANFLVRLFDGRRCIYIVQDVVCCRSVLTKHDDSQLQSIQPLLKLAVLAISIQMNGKSPNELRPMFGISNDLNDPKEKERVRDENEWAFEARRQFESKDESRTCNNNE
jgi:hypothetical protein